MEHEIRTRGEFRVQAEEGQQKRITGYAAMFDTPAKIGSYFTEQIRKGAFAETIRRGDDVRALFNHDSSVVLGRTVAKTLTLTEDDAGLRIEIIPPDTQAARDLMASMERGDITQMSFAFRATREEWDETTSPPTRTILAADLYDVSVVTYPAYGETSAQVEENAAKIGLRSLTALRSERGEVTAAVNRNRVARMRMQQRQRESLAR